MRVIVVREVGAVVGQAVEGEGAALQRLGGDVLQDGPLKVPHVRGPGPRGRWADSFCPAALGAAPAHTHTPRLGVSGRLGGQEGGGGDGGDVLHGHQALGGEVVNVLFFLAFPGRRAGKVALNWISRI